MKKPEFIFQKDAKIDFTDCKFANCTFKKAPNKWIFTIGIIIGVILSALTNFLI